MVYIVGPDNGVGLTLDAEIVKEVIYRVFGPHEQIKTLQSSPGTPIPAKGDVAIYLEHLLTIYPAKASIWVPNPEWTQAGWLQRRARVSSVGVKCKAATRLFLDNGFRDVRYIGWTSTDRMDQKVRRSFEFVHVAGKSQMKGTTTVVAAWARHPEWPPLNVVAWWDVLVPEASNVTLYNKLSVQAITQLQNKCLFHIIPSVAEGFSHVTNEARSVGAIPLVSNYPPQNELVDSSFGFLIDGSVGGLHHSWPLFLVSIEAVEEAVEKALALGTDEIVKMQGLSRSAYEAGKEYFLRTFSTQLKDYHE